eukprot:INCI20177.1.p1 GENE.INCI20177.1~~INCI20177.1.p1  ORF type:complete len:238 (-),score=22.95 INCI20177.1:353-1066(-)
MGGGASKASQRKKRSKRQEPELVIWELTGPDTPTFAWTPRVDEDGNEYFENTLTGQTQWEAPKYLKVGTRKLNVRYNDIVADYLKRLKFCSVDGTYNPDTLCALCEKEPAARVLWPCAHCCVCKTCEAKHEIGPPNARGTGGKWPMCPVCMNPIKLVTGNSPEAVASYYDWLNHRNKGKMDKKWVVSLGYNTNKLEKRLLNARRDESASDAVISPWSQPMQYLCSPEDSDSPGEVWN